MESIFEEDPGSLFQADTKDNMSLDLQKFLIQIAYAGLTDEKFQNVVNLMRAVYIRPIWTYEDGACGIFLMDTKSNELKAVVDIQSDFYTGGQRSILFLCTNVGTVIYPYTDYKDYTVNDESSEITFSQAKLVCPSDVSNVNKEKKELERLFQHEIETYRSPKALSFNEDRENEKNKENWIYLTKMLMMKVLKSWIPQYEDSSDLDLVKSKIQLKEENYIKRGEIITDMHKHQKDFFTHIRFSHNLYGYNKDDKGEYSMSERRVEFHFYGFTAVLKDSSGKTSKNYDYVNDIIDSNCLSTRAISLFIKDSDSGKIKPESDEQNEIVSTAFPFFDERGQSVLFDPLVRATEEVGQSSQIPNVTGMKIYCAPYMLDIRKDKDISSSNVSDVIDLKYNIGLLSRISVLQKYLSPVIIPFGDLIEIKQIKFDNENNNFKLLIEEKETSDVMTLTEYYQQKPGENYEKILSFTKSQDNYYGLASYLAKDVRIYLEIADPSKKADVGKAIRNLYYGGKNQTIEIYFTQKISLFSYFTTLEKDDTTTTALIIEDFNQYLNAYDQLEQINNAKGPSTKNNTFASNIMKKYETEIETSKRADDTSPSTISTKKSGDKSSAEPSSGKSQTKLEGTGFTATATEEEERIYKKGLEDFKSYLQEDIEHMKRLLENERIDNLLNFPVSSEDQIERDYAVSEETSIKEISQIVNQISNLETKYDNFGDEALKLKRDFEQPISQAESTLSKYEDFLRNVDKTKEINEQYKELKYYLTESIKKKESLDEKSQAFQDGQANLMKKREQLGDKIKKITEKLQKQQQIKQEKLETLKESSEKEDKIDELQEKIEEFIKIYKKDVLGKYIPITDDGIKSYKKDEAYDVIDKFTEASEKIEDIKITEKDMEYIKNNTKDLSNAEDFLKSYDIYKSKKDNSFPKFKSYWEDKINDPGSLQQLSSDDQKGDLQQGQSIEEIIKQSAENAPSKTSVSPSSSPTVQGAKLSLDDQTKLDEIINEISEFTKMKKSFFQRIDELSSFEKDKVTEKDFTENNVESIKSKIKSAENIMKNYEIQKFKNILDKIENIDSYFEKAKKIKEFIKEYQSKKENIENAKQYAEFISDQIEKGKKLLVEIDKKYQYIKKASSELRRLFNITDDFGKLEQKIAEKDTRKRDDVIKAIAILKSNISKSDIETIENLIGSFNTLLVEEYKKKKKVQFGSYIDTFKGFLNLWKELNEFSPSSPLKKPENKATKKTSLTGTTTTATTTTKTKKTLPKKNLGDASKTNAKTEPTTKKKKEKGKEKGKEKIFPSATKPVTTTSSTSASKKKKKLIIKKGSQGPLITPPSKSLERESIIRLQKIKMISQEEEEEESVISSTSKTDASSSSSSSFTATTETTLEKKPTKSITNVNYGRYYQANQRLDSLKIDVDREISRSRPRSDMGPGFTFLIYFIGDVVENGGLEPTLVIKSESVYPYVNFQKAQVRGFNTFYFLGYIKTRFVAGNHLSNRVIKPVKRYAQGYPLIYPQGTFIVYIFDQSSKNFTGRDEDKWIADIGKRIINDAGDEEKQGEEEVQRLYDDGLMEQYIVQYDMKYSGKLYPNKSVSLFFKDVPAYRVAPVPSSSLGADTSTKRSFVLTCKPTTGARQHYTFEHIVISKKKTIKIK